MSELSERLREAHPNSQQYALGSSILLEAAQEIESLQASVKELKLERKLLHKAAPRRRGMSCICAFPCGGTECRPTAKAQVPENVKNALSNLDKSYYRRWRLDFEAGDRCPSYVCGNINTVLITEIVEWARSLVSPRS